MDDYSTPPAFVSAIYGDVICKTIAGNAKTMSGEISKVWVADSYGQEKMKKLIGLVLVASLLSGCGTLFGRHDGGYSGGIYPATKFDFRSMADTPFPVPLLLILDLPFSLISDTIMIPADI